MPAVSFELLVKSFSFISVISPALGTDSVKWRWIINAWICVLGNSAQHIYTPCVADQGDSKGDQKPGLSSISCVNQSLCGYLGST